MGRSIESITSSQRTYSCVPLCSRLSLFTRSLAIDPVFESWSQRAGSVYFVQKLFHKRGTKK